MAVVACTALLGISAADADAAQKRITGKLSKRGYDVIALAANGKARSVRARPRFKLRPPAKRITLHLRAPDGTYAGPVVVARQRRGRRAILGVKAGAKLGTVDVRSPRGFAKVKRNLPERRVGLKRWARAKRGVPIGAGNFGRVRSRASGRAGPGRDLDLDGVPDVLDIDDDGDLILDNLDLDDLDRSVRAQASQFAPDFNLFTGFWGYNLADTVNANATALTTQRADAFLSEFGVLVMGVVAEGAELDCGGLVYCSAGGTGRVPGEEPFPGAPFPGDPGGAFDPDADGFGTMQPGPEGGMHLSHGATTAQIGTGDSLVQRVTPDGEGLLATVQYVFATVPALVSYDDGAGNSGLVTYPVPGHSDPSGPGPGSMDNGFPVSPRPPGDSAAGDVVVTLTVWRPQRGRLATDPSPAAEGDSAEWTDIGHLVHTVLVSGGVGCPQSSFSGPSSTLALPTFPVNRPNAGGFVDLADDQPANASNKLTYTVNLTQCLAANGLPSWEPGEERGFRITVLSPNGNDEAAQGIFFRRE